MAAMHESDKTANLKQADVAHLELVEYACSDAFSSLATVHARVQMQAPCLTIERSGFSNELCTCLWKQTD